MKQPYYCIGSLLDETIKEKFRTNAINDRLAFVKDAINWAVFLLLLKDLPHNDTDRGGIPKIRIVTKVKVLFLQSMFNMVDEQAETLMCDRISFRNFVHCLEIIPDSGTIWLFRERLSSLERVKSCGNKCGSSWKIVSSQERQEWQDATFD